MRLKPIPRVLVERRDRAPPRLGRRTSKKERFRHALWRQLGPAQGQLVAVVGGPCRRLCCRALGTRPAPASPGHRLRASPAPRNPQNQRRMRIAGYTARGVAGYTLGSGGTPHSAEVAAPPHPPRPSQTGPPPSAECRAVAAVIVACWLLFVVCCLLMFDSCQLIAVL